MNQQGCDQMSHALPDVHRVQGRRHDMRDHETDERVHGLLDPRRQELRLRRPSHAARRARADSRIDSDREVERQQPGVAGPAAGEHRAQEGVVRRLLQGQAGGGRDGAGDVVVLIEGVGDRGEEPLGLAGHERLAQAVLVAELPVERRPRDPGVDRDLADAHPLPAPLDGVLVGRLEDPFAHLSPELQAQRLAAHRVSVTHRNRRDARSSPLTPARWCRLACRTHSGWAEQTSRTAQRQRQSPKVTEPNIAGK